VLKVDSTVKESNSVVFREGRTEQPKE